MPHLAHAAIHISPTRPAAAYDLLSGSITLAWRSVLDKLHPGGHLALITPWGMPDIDSIALRLAGFELRDVIAYSTDSDLALTGWIPVFLFRRPLDGTVANNTISHGCGGLNIDACRVPIDPKADASQLRTMSRNRRESDDGWGMSSVTGDAPQVVHPEGRWPANLVIDGSEKVERTFSQAGIRTSGKPGTRRKAHETHSMSGRLNVTGDVETGYGDGGSVGRFFNVACDLNSLLRHIVRLIVPTNGTVLDLTEQIDLARIVGSKDIRVIR